MAISASLLMLLLPALLLALVPTFLIEALLRPRPLPVWRRPTACLALHLGVLLLIFMLELAVFRRPYFAALSVLGWFGFVVLVSVAKEQVLREPFIYQDFDYFTDAIRHPRLYLPFLGWARALLVVAGLALAITGGMLAEAPVTVTMPMAPFIGLLAVLGMAAVSLLWLGSRAVLAPVFRPPEDLVRLGLIGSLWSYAVAERRDAGGRQMAPAYGVQVTQAAMAQGAPSPLQMPLPQVQRQPLPERSVELPHLVVVQSESFFDARRLFAGIKPAVLSTFDALGATALQHGRLQVPAWGANTVRTEFGFLSALPADSLGVHRFNPYRRLARTGVPTLASHLRAQGYRTVCVHPYIAAFYDRDVVYPMMGFDDFIDIEAFTKVMGQGPYVGDIDVARKVAALLDVADAQPTGPMFIFVITMENHGPLHLETMQAGDVARLYDTAPPAGCEDLTYYLRHLCNADRMLALLAERLRASQRAGCLCFYGDHVPIMASVYGVLGEPDGATEYLLWHSRNELAAARPATTVGVEDLAGLILDAISGTVCTTNNTLATATGNAKAGPPA